MKNLPKGTLIPQNGTVMFQMNGISPDMIDAMAKHLPSVVKEFILKYKQTAGPVPVRLQRKRYKGYTLPPNTKSVTRPGPFGNPFAVGYIVEMSTVLTKECTSLISTSEQAVILYRAWLTATVEGRQRLEIARRMLKGCNLACYCAIGEPCHADVLLELVNQ